MNFNEAIDFTKKFVEFDTYNSEGKTELLLYIKDILEKRTDCKVEIYDSFSSAPYLVAKKLVDNPKFKLLLEGHLDVVSPEGMENAFNPKITNGIMHGRGSSDMKSGCACQLKAFIEATNTDGLLGDIYLAYTTDEEYESQNIIDIFEKGIIPKVDFCIIAEPTEGSICNAHKGQAFIEVNFYGKTAHSSVPHLGENAIYQATEFINELRNLMNTYEEHEKFGKETYSVGIINGGSGANVVANHCKMLIDKRFLPNRNVSDIKDELLLVISKCKQKNEKFNAEFEIIDVGFALFTDETSDDFKKIECVINEYKNTNGEYLFWSAWGEGGVMCDLGIPTIYFGPGDIKCAHSPEENVKVSEIEEVSKVYYNIIKKMCF